MLGSTTLLSSIVQQRLDDERGEPAITAFSPAGDPHAIAIVDAAIADYHHVTGRTRPTERDLLDLAGAQARGSAVTLLCASENVFGAPFIETLEGILFLGPQGQLALLPQGARTHGIALQAASVLDVEPGGGATETLRRRVQAVRAALPQVTALTPQHLLALPTRAGDPAPIGLGVFGTWRTPEGECPGAIWLLHSYHRGDDIAEGFLLLRPEHGISEHGSVPGRILPGVGGAIVATPAMDLDEAISLGDLPYPQALARFVTRTPDPH